MNKRYIPHGMSETQARNIITAYQSSIGVNKEVEEYYFHKYRWLGKVCSRPEKANETPIVVPPGKKFEEKDGIIRFSVERDGTIGEEWVPRLETQGIYVGSYAEQMLRSPNFEPGKPGIVETVVLTGKLFGDYDRLTESICNYAANLKIPDGRKLVMASADMTCLICEKFTNKEIEAMGLWYIVVMHEPIDDSDGDLVLLSAHRDDNDRWLTAVRDRPAGRWHRNFGFAFVVSEI